MRQDPLSDADYAALDRYFAGEASAADHEAVQQLLTQRPDLRERVHAVMRGVQGLMPVAPETQRSWEAFLTSAIPISSGTAPSQTPRPTRSARNSVSQPRWAFAKRQHWATLAVVTCVVLVTMLGWNLGASHLRQRVASAISTYTTANGQRATYTLPDGGTVSLNVGSRLNVPGDYAAGDRTVRLVGEALFAVAHTDGTPFTVVTGRDTIRVLGTSFVVRRYPTDSLTTVAVHDGKVAVRSLVLTAAQQVALGRYRPTAIRPADASMFSFATGVLVLNGVRFPEAVAELDRWYDADIRLSDPVLADRHVAGEFAAGTIADLAEYLSGTFGVRVVRNGRVLTLFPR